MRTPPQRAGFTLVEILTAGILFLGVLVMLASILNSVTTLSSQATAKLEALRTGREILDMIGRDLSQIVATHPSFSPRALSDASTAPPETMRNPALQFYVNPPQLGAAYKNPSAFFWVAKASQKQAEGDLAIVGYFVEKPSLSQAQLRRVLIPSSDASLYKIYSTPSNWLPSSTLTGHFTSAAQKPGDPGWLADGVLALWVRCLDERGVVITRDGEGNLRGYDFDSRLGYRSLPGPTPAANAPYDPSGVAYRRVNVLPAYVEIGLVCIAPKDLPGIERATPTPVITAPSQSSFQGEIASYLTTFQTENPRVKTAVALSRRFRIQGNY